MSNSQCSANTRCRYNGTMSGKWFSCVPNDIPDKCTAFSVPECSNKMVVLYNGFSNYTKCAVQASLVACIVANGCSPSDYCKAVSPSCAIDTCTALNPPLPTRAELQLSELATALASHNAHQHRELAAATMPKSNTHVLVLAGLCAFLVAALIVVGIANRRLSQRISTVAAGYTQHTEQLL
jgi:hypothetical protein